MQYFKILYDYLGREISPEDIVKRERFVEDKVVGTRYFYYGINRYNKGFRTYVT